MTSPKIRFTIRQAMVAIAIVALLLAAFHNALLFSLWIFSVGPVCGSWLLRRKGDWVILGGGAGGAAACFLPLFGVYLHEYNGPEGFGIGFVFFLSVMAIFPGFFVGLCTESVMLFLTPSPAPPPLPDAVGPIDVEKWQEINSTATRTLSSSRAF